MQEKLRAALYSEQIQILLLVLFKGSRCTGQNILLSLNTLFELHMKSNNLVQYQQNLLLKKEKTIAIEILHLVTNVYEDGNFSRQVAEKQDYVSVNKEVQNQKLCNIQESLLLARIIYCFQRKTIKCKSWALKFLCLETKIMCSGSLKNYSLCLSLQRSLNVVLPVYGMDWELTHKELIKKFVYNTESNKCIMRWCESGSVNVTLK